MSRGAAEIAVGTTVPERTVTPTLRQLVRYAGASGDFYEMHYDRDFAASLGHPELAVHGLLKAANLGRLVRDWLEPGDRLLSFELSYRGLDFRNEPFVCGGVVTAIEDGIVTLDLWIDAADGRRTTFGAAQVRLGA